MESERLPGAPNRPATLGPGGLSDVEWTAQLLQMQHGAGIEELHHEHAARAVGSRRCGTAVRIGRGGTAGRVADGHAGTQRDGSGDGSALRSGAVGSHRAAYGRVADGLWHGGGQQLIDEYRRTTRRGPQVMERVFYGTE